MISVFYTTIDAEDVVGGERKVFERARLLGYDLVKFEGWTDSDIGYGGNRGTRYPEYAENKKRIREIVDSFQSSYLVIQHVRPSRGCVMEDEEGLALIRRLSGETSED